jgi:hypothetical protein
LTVSQKQHLPEYETQFGPSPITNRAVSKIPETATLRIESHLSTTPRLIPADRLATLAYVGAPFELADEIGRGGHGVIYKAIQNSLGRIVAIKQLREDIYEQACRETG